jgi:glycosyltransferase involved in cell wall biosynthesis
MNYASYKAPDYEADKLRLEGVTTCIGFDDLLDHTLTINHPHFDTMIVVTSHDDKKTHAVARKHGVFCVQTDLFKKNGRNFNKGAAINAGFDRFQYFGWRMHLDADIALPDNFKRILFNHTALNPHCIYGADRVNIVGVKAIKDFIRRRKLQHTHSCLVESHGKNEARYVDPLRGYCPLGFFQLWNARAHKSYPYSLGNAAHDDVMFSSQWPHSQRRHLPTAVCYQLCGSTPKWGENWEGHRKQVRIG